MDEILQRLEAAEARVKALEELLTPERIMAHDGVAVVAGEGLRGGGTIDRTRGFALATDDLEQKAPRLGTEFVIFYEPSEGTHFKCETKELGRLIIRQSGLVEELEEVKRLYRDLLERVSLLTVYERLERVELAAEVLENEIEEMKETKDA